MKNTSHAIVRAVARIGWFSPCVVLLLPAIGCSNGLNAGRVAPPLGIKTWVNTAEDKPIKLWSIRGKPVLVEFWSRQCASCVEHIPEMSGLQHEFGPAGLQFVSVHVDLGERDDQATRRFIEAHGIAFPVGLDSDRRAMRKFEIKSVPYVLLIDERGIVRWSGDLVWGDWLVWKDLRDGIEREMARFAANQGNSGPVSTTAARPREATAAADPNAGN